MNLESFIMFIQTNPMLMIFVGGIIIVCILSIIIKIFGLKYINITESIIVFAKNNLEHLGIGNEKIKLLLDIMAQAITIAVVIDENATNAEKVEDAMVFVSNISYELDVTFSPAEKEIIAVVFGLLFIFIDTLKISPTKVKYHKLVKANLKFNKK